PSTANPEYGIRSPRATHSAHDCSATPHCSSPPPFVIESPKASTPSRDTRGCLSDAEALGLGLGAAGAAGEHDDRAVAAALELRRGDRRPAGERGGRVACDADQQR